MQCKVNLIEEKIHAIDKYHFKNSIFEKKKKKEKTSGKIF